MTELLVRQPIAAPPIDEAPPRREGRVRFLVRRPGLVVSIVYVALVLIAAFAPHVLAPGEEVPLEHGAPYLAEGRGEDREIGPEQVEQRSRFPLAADKRRGWLRHVCRPSLARPQRRKG